jgi:hypothetical protein
MRRVIWTHVSDAALAGIVRLSEMTGRRVHLWPTPYRLNDGRAGWTVVTTHIQKLRAGGEHG